MQGISQSLHSQITGQILFDKDSTYDAVMNILQDRTNLCKTKAGIQTMKLLRIYHLRLRIKGERGHTHTHLVSVA